MEQALFSGWGCFFNKTWMLSFCKEMQRTVLMREALRFLCGAETDPN